MFISPGIGQCEHGVAVSGSLTCRGCASLRFGPQELRKCVICSCFYTTLSGDGTWRQGGNLVSPGRHPAPARQGVTFCVNQELEPEMKKATANRGFQYFGGLGEIRTRDQRIKPAPHH